MFATIGSRSPPAHQRFGTFGEILYRIERSNAVVPELPLLTWRRTSLNSVTEQSSALPSETPSKILQFKIRYDKFISNSRTMTSSVSCPQSTPNKEGTQVKHIESIILRSNFITTELSSFFAQSHLPKLRNLQISKVLETPPTPSTIPSSGRIHRLKSQPTAPCTLPGVDGSGPRVPLNVSLENHRFGRWFPYHLSAITTIGPSSDLELHEPYYGRFHSGGRTASPRTIYAGPLSNVISASKIGWK